MPSRVADDRGRTRSDSSAADRELHVIVQGPAELARFRRELRRLLTTRQVATADCEAVVLAAVEALNNAQQACQPSACRVEAIVSVIGAYVCVEVRDGGAGTKGACVTMTQIPDADAEHGRGLYLMAQLMESLEFVPRSQGTLVRMTKRLRKRQSHDDPPGTGRLAC